MQILEKKNIELAACNSKVVAPICEPEGPINKSPN